MNLFNGIFARLKSDSVGVPARPDRIAMGPRIALLTKKLGEPKAIVMQQDASQTKPQGAENVFYGWFDDVGQDVPTYEPPRDAPCPFCGRAVHAADVRTHSLMYQGEYAARSYFYRTHRTCAEKDPTRTAMDGFILDMIARNGD